MGDRAQLDAGFPMRYRLAPAGIAVLIVIGAETSALTALSLAALVAIVWLVASSGVAPTTFGGGGDE